MDETTQRSITNDFERYGKDELRYFIDDTKKKYNITDKELLPLFNNLTKFWYES